MKRRGFLEMLLAGLALMPACRVRDDTPPPDHPPEPPAAPPDPPAVDASSKIFWVKEIPDQPFGGPLPNRHAGIDGMVELMARNDLSFYKRKDSSQQSEAYGLIAADDVVLVKVNAQWKYRGCTNSDLIRGLIQRVLDHPDGFKGEVVIIENGQGRGSLNCDTFSEYGGDRSIQANANDPDPFLPIPGRRDIQGPTGLRQASRSFSPHFHRWTGSSDRRLSQAGKCFLSLLQHQTGHPRRIEGGRLERATPINKT